MPVREPLRTDLDDLIFSDPTVSFAYKLCVILHHGQTRKFSDEDYRHHPVRVAQLVLRNGGDRIDVMAALLHDALEDTIATEDYLINKGIPREAVELVSTLSRRSDDASYGAFIARICAHGERARMLKRCDVIDNFSTLPFGHALGERYVAALRELHFHSGG